MPNFKILPLSSTLLSLATVTTSGTSAVLTLPPASSFRLTVEVFTVSGTLPTLTLGLFSSSDGGTNYHGLLNSAQATTSGAGYSIVFRPYLGIGDAATQIVSPLLGTADFTNSTLAVVANGPFAPGFVKLRWVVSGTTPSLAFAVKYDAVPQDMSD